MSMELTPNEQEDLGGEFRSYPTEFDVKSDDKPNTIGTIAGYAAVFNKESKVMLDGQRGLFFERVKPHAFNKTISDKYPTMSYNNHSRMQTLGALRSGTLRVGVDSHGLQYEVDVPDTSFGRDLMVSMERGDIAHSSFHMMNAKRAWSMSEIKGIWYSDVETCALADVCPVPEPAYIDTTAAKRSFSSLAQQLDKPLEELIGEMEHHGFDEFMARAMDMISEGEKRSATTTEVEKPEPPAVNVEILKRQIELELFNISQLLD